MKFKTNLKQTFNLIDLTPLVDVVFLMLIFFIITSDILPLKSLNIENPKIERNSAPLTTQLLLVVDAQNVIYVGSKKAIVDLASLKDQLLFEIDQLKKMRNGLDPTVVVSVDRRVEYDFFLKIFSIVQESTPRIRLVYKHNEHENPDFF